MRVWMLLLCLLLSHLAQYTTDGKRFDPSMVDPLMRRSSLDKNFMRFGRSSPSYTEDDDVDDNHDSSSNADTSKEDTFLRSMRGKDSFIRFGRGKNNNLMRFGRGKQDNFMRFGRSRNDNFMRFGRGKQDNFIRFGRGKQDNYMRFGRGKQDNFMRFGRGKQDNFMRFGRNFEALANDIPENGNRNLEPDFIRDSRGKQDNFMRFGKSTIKSLRDDIPIAMRSVNSKGNSNFMRFGRARQDSFMRFGKSEGDSSVLQYNEDAEDSKEKLKEGYVVSSSDDFKREAKSKDLNLLRFGRQPPSKDDGFIRFGRNSKDEITDDSLHTGFIPPRLKRSLYKSFDSQEEYPVKIQDEIDDHVFIPYTSLPEDLEDEFSPSSHQEDYTSRRKRSLSYDSSTPSPFSQEDTSVDYISAKLRFNVPPKPEYHSSLFSAGLPNVIVGPEFSLLPDLDPEASILKKSRPGDQSFLRLG